MADEPQTPNTEATPAQPAETPPAVPAISAEQLQAMIEAAAEKAAKKARDGAYAEMRRGGEFDKAEKPKKPDAATPAQTAEELQAISEAFDDAFEGFKFPSKDAKRMARERFKSERPGDSESWAKSFMASMGWSQAATPAQPASAPPAIPSTPMSQKPVTPVASSQVAPKGSTVGEFPADPFEWSDEEVAAYVRQNYPVPHKPGDVRNRAAAKKLKQMCEPYAASRKIEREARRSR